MTVGQTPSACQLPRGRTVPAFTVGRGSQARLSAPRVLVRLDRQAVRRIAVVGINVVRPARERQLRLVELRRAAGYANIVENYFDVMALVDVDRRVVLVDPLQLIQRLGVRRGSDASQEL